MDARQIFEVFNDISQGLFGFAYVYTLTNEWRFSRRTVKRLIVLLSLLFIGLAVAILHFFGMVQPSKSYLSAIGFVLGIFVCMYTAKYRDGRALFVCFSAIAFNLAGASLGEVVGSGDTAMRILTKVTIYGLTFLFVYRYLRTPLNRLMYEMESGWYKLSLVPLSFSMLCLTLLLSGQIYMNKNFKFVATALSFVIACFYVALYHMFSILQEQYRLRSNYTLLDTQMDSLQKQMQAMESADQQLRIFRHDIRHYIALQQTCLENGDIREARQVLEQMEQTLDKVRKDVPRYTNSPYINAVIANYYEKAKEAGIWFSVKMTEPDTVKVEYIELAVVLSNALENAWKACLGIAEGAERRISLTGAQRESQYLIEIANTCDGDISFNEEHRIPVTSVEGHGYGVQSILAFAEKYHAFVDFKREGTWFKVRIILS